MIDTQKILKGKCPGCKQEFERRGHTIGRYSKFCRVCADKKSYEDYYRKVKKATVEPKTFKLKCGIEVLNNAVGKTMMGW